MHLSIGETLETVIRRWRKWRREGLPGATGEFYRCGGEELIFKNLPITAHDLVIDAGGFRGNWTAEILWRYGCSCKVYEPIPHFAERLRDRFKHNSRAEVIQRGLSDGTRKVKLTIAADGSGEFQRKRGTSVVVDMQDIADAFEEIPAEGIGCMKMNIEGGEYAVLDRMISCSLQVKVRCFLVQFHRIAEDSEQKRARIQGALSASHDRAWDYPFIWECWIRKGNRPV